MVSKRKKDYEKLKNNPRNVRFKDFKTVVKRFGFNLDRSKGSHEIYKREDVKELINLQPRKRDKSKAKPYQVGQFINIIDEYNLLEED